MSSDCFSKFGKHHTDEHKKEIYEATRRLEKELIPQFANELEKRKTDEESISFDHNFPQSEELPQLIADLHLRGINVRYLMILFKHLPSSPHFQNLVATEMVARTAKHELQKKWRELKSFNDEDYRLVALHYFNLLFGRSQHSQDYWNTSLDTDLKKKFLLEDSEIAEEVEWLKYVHKVVLFHRLQDISGVVFTLDETEEGTVNSLEELMKKEKPFELQHIGELLPKVKHIHRISFEEGTALSRLAITKFGNSTILFYFLFWF